MTSMQEYFDYTMGFLFGILGVVMKGSEDDWKRIFVKLRELKDLLKPIEKNLKLDCWWEGCKEVCSNLFKTFQGSPDQDWWSTIIYDRTFGFGASVGGWFVKKFLGAELCDIKSGLVAVPMKITDGAVTEESAVVAGFAGFNINPEEAPPVEAVHTLALIMEPDAVFRMDLMDWQEEYRGLRKCVYYLKL